MQEEPNDNQCSQLATQILQSEKKQQKDDKRRKIKEIFKQKLGIKDINELQLGRRSDKLISSDFRLIDEQIDEKNKFKDVYRFKGVLGVGVYGVVILVQNIFEDKLRALKIMQKCRLNEEETEVIKTESEILQKLQNKENIVNFVQMYESRSYIFIEMEYIPGGQLKRIYDKRLQAEKKKDYFQEQIRFLKEQTEFEDTVIPQISGVNQDEYFFQQAELAQPLFNDEEAAQIIKGLINGLFFVHELDVIHRDIKPENILLIKNDEFKSEYIKIVDFGLSAQFKSTQKCQIDDKIGTLLFMAPEQISLQTYGKKIDMFACGIVLYYMLCGKHPLYKYGDTQLIYKQKVLKIEPEKWDFPTFVSDLAKDFICRVCRISSVQRFDAKRALIHPWITRNYKDKIPLTKTEEMLQFNVQSLLSKLIRLTTFIQIVKKSNDQKSAPPSTDYPIDISYISKLKTQSYLSDEDCNTEKSESQQSLKEESSFYESTVNIEGASVNTRFLPLINQGGRISNREEQKVFSIKKQNAKKDMQLMIQKVRHVKNSDLSSQINLTSQQNKHSGSISPDPNKNSFTYHQYLSDKKTAIKAQSNNVSFKMTTSKQSEFLREDSQQLLRNDPIKRPRHSQYSMPTQFQDDLLIAIQQSSSPIISQGKNRKIAHRDSYSPSLHQSSNFTHNSNQQKSMYQSNGLNLKLNKCGDEKNKNSKSNTFNKAQPYSNRYDFSQNKLTQNNGYQQDIQNTYCLNMPPIVAKIQNVQMGKNKSKFFKISRNAKNNVNTSASSQNGSSTAIASSSNNYPQRIVNNNPNSNLEQSTKQPLSLQIQNSQQNSKRLNYVDMNPSYQYGIRR